MADSFTLHIERGEVWEQLSPNGQVVMCARTVDSVENGMVRFVEDEAPVGAALELFMDDAPLRRWRPRG